MQICEVFFNQVNLSFTKVLHVFIPIEKKREPNTVFIIERILREFPNIMLVAPRVNHVSEEMENFRFEGFHQLEKNKWGILEPKESKQVGSQEIDMVLIPLLVFDEEGHRVGYGKGFYDKLLNSCRFDCKKIGLSFFPPVKNILNKQSHDIALDCCVSPDEMYTF